MISVYVDLAIGLVLAFLLLSLLVSGINEGIVRLFGVRSKFLWAYLRDTIDGGATQGGPGDTKRSRIIRILRGILGWLAGRPLIGGVVRRIFRDFLPGKTISRLPGTVAGVFLKLPFARDPRPRVGVEPAPKDIPTTGSITDAFYQRLQEIDHGKGGATAIAEIPTGRFGVAMMELAMGHGGVQALLKRLRDQDSPMFRPLQSVWESVGGDLDAFRVGAEKWFDGEMQRLTLLYRRYVRWVVAVIGLLITLLFSMDALQYGKALLTDGAYRSAVTAFADAGPDQLGVLKGKCAGTAEGGDTYACVTKVLSSPAFVTVFGNAPLSLSIPETGSPKITWQAGDWWNRIRVFNHWPGFLVTFVALLFGASFWWDILRRLTGLRPRKDSSAQ